MVENNKIISDTGGSVVYKMALLIFISEYNYLSL